MHNSNQQTHSLTIVKRSSRKRGFTIVELLIVIVVIAVLATITTVVYRGVQDRAREATVKSDLSQAEKQLAMDKAVNGTFPTDASNANEGRGLTSSTGSSYQYTSDGSTYCLSVTNGSQSYHTTDSGGFEIGTCSGHYAGGAAPECDSGFVPVPGNSAFGTSDFCISKYEAKNSSGTAVSQAMGLPWVNITQPDAIAAANGACSGCRLIGEAEWLTVAHNVLSVASNWSGGSVGSGAIYSGHNDNAPASVLAASTDDNDGYYGTGNSSGNQRRTLTLNNGEVIWDLAGNTEEWTTGQTSGGQPGLGTLAYRNWNAIEGTGSLSPNPFPSYGTPAAASWTSAHGLGTVYSNSSDSNLRALIRGGRRNHGANAGIFALALDDPPIHARDYLGFRIVK